MRIFLTITSTLLVSTLASAATPTSTEALTLTQMPTEGSPSAAAQPDAVISKDGSVKLSTPSSDTATKSISVTESTTAAATPFTPDELKKICTQQLEAVPQGKTFKDINQICERAKQFSSCTSVKNIPIAHFDFEGDPKVKKSQRILVFGIVHGDEEQSGTVALSWLSRLREIQPRNAWRIIPVLNPDGWKTKTRTNANGVDVNRNFPSNDWDQLAHKYWKDKASSSPRRFPGNKAASEPETRCAIDHIADFKPDFVISIHTPLGMLDFDGPRVEMPKFQPLPWVRLGNYPGSLGRYMWVDRNVPVLTVELKAKQHAARTLEEFDKLQDITGTVALQAEKAKNQKKP